jgi:hypothetical protein
LAGSRGFFCSNSTMGGKLGQPAHRQHHVEVGVAEARIDVQVIRPDVLLRRGQGNRAEARVAPPGILPSPSWSNGRSSLRATPAVETSATVHS